MQNRKGVSCLHTLFKINKNLIILYTLQHFLNYSYILKSSEHFSVIQIKPILLFYVTQCWIKMLVKCLSCLCLQSEDALTNTSMLIHLNDRKIRGQLEQDKNWCIISSKINWTKPCTKHLKMISDDKNVNFFFFFRKWLFSSFLSIIKGFSYIQNFELFPKLFFSPIEEILYKAKDTGFDVNRFDY